MNHTIEGSEEKFDIVCMSFGKGKERGIEVVEAGQKDSFIEAQSMEIKTEKGRLLKNNNLETETGKVIIDFIEYKQVKYNNENRPTQHSLEMAEKNGTTKSFMIRKLKREGKLIELGKAKKKRDNEQVI